MSQPQAVDVLILGAGPAGSTAALNLAPTCSVLLVDRDAMPRLRAGESLPPAANALLRDMGLLDDFCRQGHLPCFGNRSQWGSPIWRDSDFLRAPQGHGWHLDRPRFEHWLRQHALARGARLAAPMRLTRIERQGSGWLVHVSAERGTASLAPGAAPETVPIRARVVLDAGGRTPVLAKALGAARRPTDKLVCGWLIVPDHPADAAAAESPPRADPGRGLNRIFATELGWWYSAPLPQRQRILACYTDSDLPCASALRDTPGLLGLAAGTVPEWLQEWGISAAEDGHAQPRFVHGYSAAHSALTVPAAGDGWLCAGDAALGFDPLSSQGIFNALYTGLAAAESIDRFLRHEVADFSEYSARLQSIHCAYRAHLRQWYAIETRWPQAPFWQRRR